MTNHNQSIELQSADLKESESVLRTLTGFGQLYSEVLPQRFPSDAPLSVCEFLSEPAALTPSACSLRPRGNPCVVAVHLRATKSVFEKLEGSREEAKK
jgi:hypothetical protein